MAGHPLADTGGFRAPFYNLLHGGLMQMVTADLTATGILCNPAGRKQVLPAEFLVVHTP